MADVVRTPPPVRLVDTVPDHYLTFALNEDLTANRTLNWTVGDADKSIALGTEGVLVSQGSGTWVTSNSNTDGHVLQVDSGGDIVWGPVPGGKPPGGGVPVPDNTDIVFGTDDSGKILRLEVDDLYAAPATRILGMCDYDLNLEEPTFKTLEIGSTATSNLIDQGYGTWDNAGQSPPGASKTYGYPLFTEVDSDILVILSQNKGTPIYAFFGDEATLDVETYDPFPTTQSYGAGLVCSVLDTSAFQTCGVVCNTEDVANSDLGFQLGHTNNNGLARFQYGRISSLDYQLRIQVEDDTDGTAKFLIGSKLYSGWGGSGVPYIKPESAGADFGTSDDDFDSATFDPWGRIVSRSVLVVQKGQGPGEGANRYDRTSSSGTAEQAATCELRTYSPADAVNQDFYHPCLRLVRSEDSSTPGGAINNPISAGDRLGSIDWKSYNHTDEVLRYFCRIIGYQDDEGSLSLTSSPGRIAFETVANGTTDLAERMSIRHDGDVVINDLIPGGNVSAAADGTLTVGGGGAVCECFDTFYDDNDLEMLASANPKIQFLGGLNTNVTGNIGGTGYDGSNTITISHINAPFFHAITLDGGAFTIQGETLGSGDGSDISLLGQSTSLGAGGDLILGVGTGTTSNGDFQFQLDGTTNFTITLSSGDAIFEGVDAASGINLWFKGATDSSTNQGGYFKANAGQATTGGTAQLQGGPGPAGSGGDVSLTGGRNSGTDPTHASGSIEMTTGPNFGTGEPGHIKCLFSGTLGTGAVRPQIRLGGDTDIPSPVSVQGTFSQQHTSETNYSHLKVDASYELDLANVTTAASVWLAEPNLTETGFSVTTAATLYIEDAPTEGTSNYALLIGAGDFKMPSTGKIYTGGTGAYITNVGLNDMELTASGGIVLDPGSNGLVIGSGAAGEDYFVQVNGETNDGRFTWMEDEDHWLFSDEIRLNSTEKLEFGNGTSNIYDLTGAGFLTITTSTLITSCSVGTYGGTTSTTIGTGTAGTTTTIQTGSADDILFKTSTTTRATLNADGWDLDTGLLVAHANKTADYTVTAQDYTIWVDSTSGDVTITLLASPASGRRYEIKRMDASGNVVTVDGNGDNIDGSATITISNQYDSIVVESDGTEWGIM